jgi:GR25 family glycosyltransferase involved in LPS biosynthesis
MRDTEGRPCPPTARVTTLRNESSEVVRLKREIARMSVERQRLQSFPPTARVTPLRNESSEVIRLKRAIASMSIERQRLQALLSAMARISKGDAANETRGGGRQGAADAGLPVCSNTFIGDGYCLQRRPTEAQTEWAHIEEKWERWTGGETHRANERGLRRYGCMYVSGAGQVSSRSDPSVVPYCLNGSFSWGTCRDGQWLCEAAYMDSLEISVVLDTVMVLNLPESTQRWESQRDRLSELGLMEPLQIPATHATLSRSASNSSDVTEEELQGILGPYFQKSFQFRGASGLVKLGDVSVTLSHMHAWQALLLTANQGQDASPERWRAGGRHLHVSRAWALILEDDAVLRPPASALQSVAGAAAVTRASEERERMRVELPGLPEEADLVLLHPSRLKLVPGNGRYQRATGGSGLMGYAISERGALKLLRYLMFAHIALPVDLQIYKVPGLGIFATDTDWVTHNDSLSSDRVKRNGVAE